MIQTIHPNQKLILLYIKSSSKYILNTRELSDELKIDISHIRRYLKEMEKKKLIYLIKKSNRLEVIKK
jgi:DNA-binding MarR family transcriptional regulator